ncbi:MAG TPA: phage holin family protein [Gammaproteobacteria bacterium]|nr:phage holin family protein [Gammaproteobacteria bacterium]
MEHDVDSMPPDPVEPARGPIAGLFASLAKLLATAIGIAQTRLELLTTELQEEVHRVAEIMVYAVIALLAAGVGLFLLALVVIFAFWDTHRIIASIAVTSTVFLIAVVAALVLKAKIRTKPAMLNATIAELKKDRASLMRSRS